MKLQRHGLIAGLVAGLLALSACGSDNEGDTGGGAGSTTGGTAAGIECASGSLSAAGSSAQKSAYTAWIDAYQKACGDAAINYDGQGSGNGRTQFIQKQVPLAGSDSATKFLAAQDKTAWPYEPAQAWPAKGGQGAANSAAMVQGIKGADGAIGYVDNPDAVKNSLTVAALDVGSGAVELTRDTVGKAIAAAELKDDGGDLVFSIDYGLTDAGAYPAILATYQITCTQGLSAEQAKLVKSFLTYQISAAGQKVLDDTGYVSLPTEFRSNVKAAIDALGAA